MFSSPSKRGKYDSQMMDSDDDSTLRSANATNTTQRVSTLRSVSTDSLRPGQKRKASSELLASPPSKVARADNSPDPLLWELENTLEVLIDDPLVVGADPTEDDDLPQVINVVRKYEIQAA